LVCASGCLIGREATASALGGERDPTDESRPQARLNESLAFSAIGAQRGPARAGLPERSPRRQIFRFRTRSPGRRRQGRGYLSRRTGNGLGGWSSSRPGSKNRGAISIAHAFARSFSRHRLKITAEAVRVDAARVGTSSSRHVARADGACPASVVTRNC
jgi:hypothetical protein